MYFNCMGTWQSTREYERNKRHNVGFSVIDVLADKYNNIDVSDRKHKGAVRQGV